MKEDEQRLLNEIRNRARAGEIPYVRLIVRDLGINENRAAYICEKWTRKGWYDYRVNVLAGWLTNEAPNDLNDLLAATSENVAQQMEINMNKFAFEIGQVVKLADSEEVGKVTGRAEYQYAENSYYIRYKAGDGRAVEAWWTESALVAA